MSHNYYDYADAGFLPAPVSYASQRQVVTGPCAGCHSSRLCTCPVGNPRGSYSSTTVYKEVPVSTGYTSIAPRVRSASVTPVAPNYASGRYVENVVRAEPVLLASPAHVLLAQQPLVSGYQSQTAYYGGALGQPAALAGPMYYEKSGYANERLKEDNRQMSREIHELKKREASSFLGRGKEAELSRLRQENVDLIAEVNNLRARLSQVNATTISNYETTITNLRQNVTELETANGNLAAENRQLKAQGDRIRVETERRVTSVNQGLTTDIETLKTHLTNEVDNANALNEELTRVRSENGRLKAQYEQLVGRSLPIEEHESIVAKLRASLKSAELDKSALERQVTALNNERSGIRREAETQAENRRRDAKEFDTEVDRLRGQLDIEIENRNELLRDLEELRRHFELLKAENQQLSALKSCKYHNEDGSLVADSQVVARLNKQLQERNAEIAELNQQLLSLRQEISSLKIRHAETVGNLESSLEGKTHSERQKYSVLQLENEELKLKNSYLTREVERIREAPIRSSSVERQVVTAAPTTVTTTIPLTTTTRVYRPSEDVQRTSVVENVRTYETRPETVTTYTKTYPYNKVEYVSQPTTTVYASPTYSYAATPVTYTVPQVVTTSYRSEPLVYETTAAQPLTTYSSSFVNAQTATLPTTTVITKTTEVPETVTTKSEVRRSVIRI